MPESFSCIIFQRLSDESSSNTKVHVYLACFSWENVVAFSLFQAEDHEQAGLWKPEQWELHHNR